MRAWVLFTFSNVIPMHKYQSMFRLITIRALRVGASIFNASGDAGLAAYYESQANVLITTIRGMGGTPWYSTFGLHAAADAVNAGFLDSDEQAGIAAGEIGDPVKLPSQSNFNQYFILQVRQSRGCVYCAGQCTSPDGLTSLRRLWRGLDSWTAASNPFASCGAPSSRWGRRPSGRPLTPRQHS